MKVLVYAPPEPIQTPPEESLALVPVAWKPREVSLLASSGVRAEDVPPVEPVELGCVAVDNVVAVTALVVPGFVTAVFVAVLVAVLPWLTEGWVVVTDTVEAVEGGLGLPHLPSGSRALSARLWTTLA